MHNKEDEECGWGESSKGCIHKQYYAYLSNRGYEVASFVKEQACFWKKPVTMDATTLIDIEAGGVMAGIGSYQYDGSSSALGVGYTYYKNLLLVVISLWPA